MKAFTNRASRPTSER